MYLSVREIAERWNVSERSVRNYCANGLIVGAFLTGKTWNIPDTATKPTRKNAKIKAHATLLDIIRDEMQGGTSGGIYHKVQIDLTYNSNRIEGSMLSHDETRYIFETNTIGTCNKTHRADDIVETSNHFRCIDIIIENASKPISESLVKQLHLVLKNGTADSRKSWFRVGEYKKLANEVGGRQTTLPNDVAGEIKSLLDCYNAKQNVTFDDILEFHHAFESIHPFQDGNGRVGRLLMFKECLRHNIVPFIIDDEHKLFYYRGLAEWQKNKGYLTDTCLSCQDKFKTYLEYFSVPFVERREH